MVVRHPDGSLTIDRQPVAALNYFLQCTAVGFLTGVVLYAPLTGATVGAMMGGLISPPRPRWESTTTSSGRSKDC